MKKIKAYSQIIGVVLFIYILSQIDFQKLSSIFQNINLVHFAAAIILLHSALIFRILKWKILVQSQTERISLKELSKIFFKGLSLGVVTPGKIGEFWKAKYLTEVSDISLGRGFYIALMDRLIDIIIIIPIGITGIVILFLFNKIKIEWTVIISIAVLAIFIAYFLIKQGDIKKVLKFFAGVFVPRSIRERANSFFDDFFQGTQELSRILFVKMLGCGLVYYSISVLCQYFVALSLGFNIPFWYLFLIVAPVWLVLMLPVTVLGIGTRDISYGFFFSIYGITLSQAVAFSLLILFCNILLSLPGVILFVKKII